MSHIRDQEDASSAHSNDPILPGMAFDYTPSGLPPHKLELKIRAPVMIIQNVAHHYLANAKIFAVKQI